MSLLTDSLAKIMLGGAWSRLALLRRTSVAVGFSGGWLRTLVNDLLAEFPDPPHAEPGRLSTAIGDHPSFARLARRQELPRSPVQRLLEPLPFVPGPHPVPAIAGARDLCRWLELPPEWLDWFVDLRGLERTCGDEALRHYRRTWLPKASGGTRLIEAPKQRLKGIQRRILHGILDQVPVHGAAHGCVPGRSAVTHARLHQGRRVVAQFDLSDFFTTIDRLRVAGIFRMLGYPRPTAFALASLCTTRTPAAVIASRPRPPSSAEAARQWAQHRRLGHPHLPQGGPTSPSLANLCAFPLDVRLSALAASLGFTYSRYVDDLAFSGDVPMRLASLTRLVQPIVKGEGFVLNPAKSRLQRRHQQQRVTGLVVNAAAGAPRFDFDRLRATLHRARLFGVTPPAPLDAASWRQQLVGEIAWIGATSATRAARLRRAFEAINWT